MITVKKATESIVKYRVDEKNKRVVCIITGCSNIAVSRIVRYTKHIVNLSNTKRYQLADEYVGVAKCNEKDTFDVQTGKRIALTKAKKARANAVNRMIAKFNNDMGIVCDKLNTFGISKYDEDQEVDAHG